MTESLVFAPLVDLRLIWGLMVLAMALLGFALWKGLRGWPFREQKIVHHHDNLEYRISANMLCLHGRDETFLQCHHSL